MRVNLKLALLAASTSILPIMSGACAEIPSRTGWDGVWITAESPTRRLEVAISDGALKTLAIDGTPVTMLSHEISPDRQIMLFTWDTGQGSLRRLNDETAEASVFGKSLKLEAVTLSRRR